LPANVYIGAGASSTPNTARLEVNEDFRNEQDDKITPIYFQTIKIGEWG
jgi:hypothetical protein